MKKVLIVGLLTGLLASCALTGGETAYELEPIITPSGEIVCCKVIVNNTKDYEKLKLRMEKRADGSLLLTLEEDGVSASDPAAVAAANQSKLIDTVSSLVRGSGN